MIDGQWIKARLTGERGQKARLAEALGVKSDVVAKVLSGVRKLTPAEIDIVRTFFGDPPLSPSEKEFVDLFRNASEDRRQLVREFLRLHDPKEVDSAAEKAD